MRIGGAIRQPELLDRVAPVYPPVAEQSRVGGIVVLEAVVGSDGHVDDVRVLRSVPLLDRAAIDAVRQWRYSPLVLDGRAAPFIVTVTVRFDVPR